MINKIKIEQYTFMADVGSTFIEYSNCTGDSGHFNIDKDLDFAEACKIYFDRHIVI